MGKTLTIREWAIEAGLKKNTLARRLKNYPIDLALII